MRDAWPCSDQVDGSNFNELLKILNTVEKKLDTLIDIDFEKEDNKYQEDTKKYVESVIRQFLVHYELHTKQVLDANSYL